MSQRTWRTMALVGRFEMEEHALKRGLLPLGLRIDEKEAGRGGVPPQCTTPMCARRGEGEGGNPSPICCHTYVHLTRRREGENPRTCYRTRVCPTRTHRVSMHSCAPDEKEGEREKEKGKSPPAVWFSSPPSVLCANEMKERVCALWWSPVFADPVVPAVLTWVRRGKAKVERGRSPRGARIGSYN